jgi:hypothetical protein
VKFKAEVSSNVFILILVILHNFRLTPVYAVIIAFGAVWYIHMSEGPMWNSVVGIATENCRRHWWINLLYLNNYYKVEGMVSSPYLKIIQNFNPLCANVM